MSGSGEKQHVAFFPGSFDPVTFGHLDVIRRGRRLFDRVVVGVGRNPGKVPLFSDVERLEMVRELVDGMVADEDDAAPVDVDGYEGLTVEHARAIGATALLRGIRNLSDLQSEVQQALTNRQIAGIETVFVVAGQDFAYTSSSLIRQVTAMGDDLDVLASMCPGSVIERLRKKKDAGHEVLRLLAEHE